MSRAVHVWGPTVLWAGVIFFLSSLSHVPGSSLLDQVPGGDKVGHSLLYGVLGLTLARAGRSQGTLPHLVFILLGALYGASDEFHQSFVPGRQVSFFDWVADVVGTSAGYWIGLRHFFASGDTPDAAPAMSPR